MTYIFVIIIFSDQVIFLHYVIPLSVNKKSLGIHTRIFNRSRVDTVDVCLRLRRKQKLHIIPLEAWHSARQHEGMMFGVLGNEVQRPLENFDRVSSRVVVPPTRSLLLWNQAFLLVPGQESSQTVLAHPVDRYTLLHTIG